MLHDASGGFFQMTSSRDLTTAKKRGSLPNDSARIIAFELDIDPDISIPRQIVEHIEDLLALGLYSPGDMLPSAAALADELEVSKRTIEQAYAILSQRGITESVSGRPSKIATSADTRAAFAQRKFTNVIRDLRLLPIPMSKDELRIAHETAVRKYFSQKKK